MRQLIILGLAAVLIVGFSIWRFFPKSPREPGRCPRCNVILVSVDSLRADRMSVYSYERDTTPHLSAWAKNALVFDKYFATAFLTPISEASVHTGLYPEKNGLIGFRSSIAKEVPTLAEILKKSGYRTGMFGNSQEFLLYQSIRESFNRGFDRSRIINRMAKKRELPWQRIESFLSRDDETPFFLWIPIGNVHAPFGVDMENRFADPAYNGPLKNVLFMTNLQLYYDGILYPAEPKFQFFMEPVAREHPDKDIKPMDRIPHSKPVRIKDTDLRYVSDQYDNGVFDADRLMGRLLEMVKENDHESDTVIIFQSEHGEDLGEHKYIAHYDIWDTTVHVPLIFKSPTIPKGQRVPHLVSGVDVLPSLLDHLALTSPERLDGLSFLDHSAAEVEVRRRREHVFLTRVPLWESVLKQNIPHSIFDKFRALDDQSPLRDYAIRDDNYKLFHRRARFAEEMFSVWKYVSGKSPEREEFELYDIQGDATGSRLPLEKYETDVQRLKSALLAWEKEIESGRRKTRPTQTLQTYQ